MALKRKKYAFNPNKAPVSVDIESSYKSLLEENRRVIKLLEKRKPPVIRILDYFKKRCKKEY